MEPSAVRAAYVTAEGVEREADLSGLDVRDVAWGMPVRVPPSFAGQRNYPGLFWSTTNRDHVVYESLLELSWLWLADFDAKTALQLHEISDVNSARYHVTISGRRRIRRSDNERFVVHAQHLISRQLTWWHQMQVVTPATAIEQCIDYGTPTYLVRDAIERARRTVSLRAADADRLHQMLEARSRRSGT